MGLNFEFMAEVFPVIVKKLPINLELTFIPFLAGLAIAVVITFLREIKLKALQWFLRFYISFIRGTPLVLQLYLVFYALPELARAVFGLLGKEFDINKLSVMLLCMIALSINISAYLAETIRSGISAVRIGEIEAGYSISMTKAQVMRRIVLPQAFQISLPNLCTLIIAALQNTVVVFFVTLEEMNAMGSIAAQNNWLYFESFLVVGLIFWVITILTEMFFHALERYAGLEKKQTAV
ncbi:MAG: amino acid ABC transporter permease [Synergistaceae bacterium]|jgi:His/Glu/Gln/Arg/opine family amino acid ABC transporter permease subunit|nr:amino acid ABC transporter permease [Synergistaceae bacterium]